MARTSREVANRVRCNVLDYLARRASKRPQGVCVSYREIERALGYSPGRVRHTCRQLVGEGYVCCISCFAKDGGQRANTYVITPKGWSDIEARANRRAEVAVVEA